MLAAIRLGYQVEANWTHPLIYVIYALVRPLAATLLLYFMYVAVGKGRPGTGDFLAYALVGNALWTFVQVTVNGLNTSMLDDREHYQMIRYVYVAPVGFPLYVIARALAYLIIAASSAILLLVMAVVVFKVTLNPAGIDWPLLFISNLVGITAAVAFGMALASASLSLSRHAFIAGEATAAALYLLSGAIFPITLLPGWLQTVCRVLPLTYWLDGSRQALLGSRFVVDGTHPGSLEFYLQLIGTGACLVLASALTFRFMVSSARHRGVLDRSPAF
jgi:ABC-2 type transport system permease protein